MFILTVAPIARGIPHGNLTYFAKENPPLGSLIMVPVRTREVPALVLAVSEASESKSSLKQSQYTIRKIACIKPRLAWSQEFLQAVQATADYSAQDFGETLLALTPATILEQFIAGTQTGQHSGTMNTAHKTSIFAAQATTKVRMSMYQRLIREAFARGQSVFICLPQELDVERVIQELSRGIENYTLSFTSSMTKKKILAGWERAAHEEHPILVVGTAQYLTLPRLFDTIIIDEEHSRSWKTLARPTVDLRVFVESYAILCRATLIIGAPILRSETHKRLTTGGIHAFERIATHAHRELLEQRLHTEIVNPKLEEKALKDQTGQRIFSLISTPFQNLLSEAVSKKESVLFITARKGLSPIIRCGDCGTIVCCPECETPLVLHSQKDNARIFSCHACGYIRTQTANSFEKCKSCDGWKLESLGIGTERIIDELELILPDKSVLLFDGDAIKTATQAKKRIAQFTKDAEERRAPIMVGTPMVIPYITTVDHVCVISLDSLFAIPDIRMHERIFGMILSLREKAQRSLVIQTRLDDTTILKAALAGDLATFTQEELTLRKTFSYPPYGTIIKITVHEKKERCAQEMENIRDFFKTYNPIIPPTMSRDPKGLYKMHALIKLPEGVWGSTIDTHARELLKKLRALPRHVNVEINPDNLL